jgi:tripartite-type tricarboxylate transporter receptor subunit TctC
MKGTATVVAAFAAIVTWQGAAHSQSKPGTFPAKPVRLVVPWPAGGGTDIITRIVAQKMGENMGQTVLVDNRSGASGIIGSDHVAKSAPDGYTLLMGNTATNATNASVYKKLPYDPLRDFVTISLVANSPYIMSVHPSLPVKSVKEFIALAKARPGELNFGSGGVGSAPHLAAALFNYLAGIKVTHVAYKGGAAHTPALISGEVQVTFTNPPEVMPHIKAGKLRALAVTSPERWRTAPELPTIREAGVPAYEFTIWWGLVAPTGTPAPVIERLHAELVKAATDKSVKDGLARQGVDVVAGTPAEFTKLIRSEVEKWKKVAAEAKIQLD